MPVTQRLYCSIQQLEEHSQTLYFSFGMFLATKLGVVLSPWSPVLIMVADESPRGRFLGASF